MKDRTKYAWIANRAKAFDHAALDDVLTCEADLQVACVAWLGQYLEQQGYPGAFYAVSNESDGSRSYSERLRWMGRQAGQPDLCIAVPRIVDVRLYAALYVELKWGRNKATARQRERLEALRGAGNAVTIQRSFQGFVDAVRTYIETPQHFVNL